MKQHLTGRLAAAFLLSFCIIITGNNKILKGLAGSLKTDNGLKDNQTYLNQLEDIKVFNNDETLLTKEELTRLRNTSYKPCTYEFKGDKNDLYNTIISNSNKFLQNHREYKSLLEIEDTGIREYVIQVIKNIIERNLKEQKKDNIHKLTTLKVVIGSLQEETLSDLETGSASITGEETNGEYRACDNLIILDIDSILKPIYSIDDIYMGLYDLINHEFNHAFQGSCADILPNSVSFIVESSAESYNYNVLQSSYKPINKNFSFEYAYSEEREYESKLFLLSLLDNSKSIKMYYEAIDKGDLGKFFAFLDLYGREKQEELLQGIWLADGVMLRNDYWCRVLKTNDFKALNDYNLPELLKGEAKGAFESFILKNAVSNLIQHNITNKDLSLEENLIIYHFILLNVLDTVSYNGYSFATCEASYTFYADFYRNYVSIESCFFEFLGSYYDLTSEEVNKFYERMDKEKIVDSIDGYVRNSSYLKDGDSVKRLVDKYPKIRTVMKGIVVLSNYNYDNIKSLRNNEYNKGGVRLILK